MDSYTFKNLQVLRGVAAMLVAYFHLQPMLAIPYDLDANDYTGAFGVDLFFVISGFVMYISNGSMNRPKLAFLIGRFFRIVPLYWLSTFVLVALFYAGFHPNGLNHFEPSMLPRSMFFIMSAFPDGRHDLILSLGWTLIYELSAPRRRPALFSWSRSCSGRRRRASKASCRLRRAPPRRPPRDSRLPGRRP